MDRTDADERHPLHLVTGFLGSGKTTLVNAVLRDPAFAGTLVVVNEFGEVGLDHLLVSQSQDQVVLLDTGCLCCAASGSLRDTLIDLFARRSTRELPQFDRIVVETSGLVNPVPVVAALLGDSALTTRCRLAGVLTLVDAVAGIDSLASYAEARQQVALADRLLVTKGDIADTACLERVVSRLRELNPHAPIDQRHLGESPSTYFDDVAMQFPATPATPAVFVRGPMRSQYGGDEPSASAHGPAWRNIETHTWRLPASIGWSDYAAWSQALRRHFGARLLRCKGLVAIDRGASADGIRWVVQGVQGYFAPPRQWAGDLSSDDGFIVCIVDGVDRTELEADMALLGAQPFRAGSLQADITS